MSSSAHIQGIWKDIPLLYLSFIFNDGFNMALTMTLTMPLIFSSERVEMLKESKKINKTLKGSKKTLKESKKSYKYPEGK